MKQVEKKLSAFAVLVIVVFSAMTVSAWSINFDFSDNSGSYTNGTESPAHATGALSLTRDNWNVVVGDKTNGLVYATGAAATGVEIDFGKGINANATLNWAGSPDEYDLAPAGGIYDTVLMKDYIFANQWHVMPVRVRGLSAGRYNVFALARSGTNSLDALRKVYIGTGDDTVTIADLTEYDVAASTNIYEWTQDEDYILRRVSVTGPTQWVVVVLRNISNQYSEMPGLQIISTVNETVILIR